MIDVQDSGTDPGYHTPSDADTLQKHAEIRSDPKRHKAAMKHLADRNQHGVDAEKMARKHLEKSTKSRMKKAFNSNDTGKAEEANESEF
jgi:hypothetical protein